MIAIFDFDYLNLIRIKFYFVKCDIEYPFALKHASIIL